MTGRFDGMPGDEAVATGLEGDPVLSDDCIDPGQLTVYPWTCPTGGGWTLSSTGMGIGTSPVVELCDVDCSVVTAKIEAVDDRYPAAVELADLDGDGNLDLLVLVELAGG